MEPAGGYKACMPALRSFTPWSCALAAAVGGHLCLLGWLAPGPPEQRVRPAVAGVVPAAAKLADAITSARVWRVAGTTAAAAPAAADVQAPGARQRKAAVRVSLAASAPPAARASMPAGPPPAVAAPAAAASTPRLKLPPAERLQFAAQRGSRSGHAELRWERGEAGYELLLVLRYDGEEREALIQSSRGELGEAGLQPHHYADRRGDAGLRSVNFGQEDDAGPSVPGAQDRLSWLVQLAATAAAWTEMPAQGTRIVLPVAGARGECEDWVFEVIGLQPAQGAASLLHLSRAPLHRYDHRIDVWLDAARSGWPVRMSWSHPARETLVFVRENATQQR